MLIDDDKLVNDFIARILARFAPETEVVTSLDPRQGLNLALQQDFDVVVTDLKMPVLSGLDITRSLHERKPKLPVILITGYGNPDLAMEAGKLGVHEFLAKPFTPEQLLEAVESAVEIKRLATEPVALPEESTSELKLVGNSEAMRNLALQIGRIAESDLPVLIQGPLGSGKKMVARALYQKSGRAAMPLVVVNCTAALETALDVELFGVESHEAAQGLRVGRLEQVDGGTLLLDEISELPLEIQSRITRLLQEGHIYRQGGQSPVPVNVRLLATTSKNLEDEVKAGRFREDLYFRLRVLSLQVPSLAERKEDIPLLVKDFLGRHGPRLGYEGVTISEDALDFLQEMSWPGNVLQLENIVCELILQAAGLVISRAQVESFYGKTEPPVQYEGRLSAIVARELRRAQMGEIPAAYPALMDHIDREIFSQAYELAKGNRSRMARLLGLSRPTVLEKIALFGLGSINKRRSARRMSED